MSKFEPLSAPVDDVQEWKKLTHVQRIRPIVLRWVEYGAESPPAVHIFYLLKIAIYAFGGLSLIALTLKQLR